MSGLAIIVKGTTFEQNVGTVDVPIDGKNVEVRQFVEATGLTAHEDGLNVLVSALKDAGIWDKVIALYPMLGTTFEQMSYNLKDISVAKLSMENDPVIAVTEDVGWKRTSGGFISANYGFPNNLLNDYHMLASTDINYNTVSTCVPIGVGAMTNGSCIILIGSKNIIFRNTQYTGIQTGATNLPVNGGLVIASTRGVIVNGVAKAVSNLSSGGFNNTLNGSPISIGGYNTAAFSPPTAATLPTWTYKYAGFGMELTESEMLTYSNLLNQFKETY